MTTIDLTGQVGSCVIEPYPYPRPWWHEYPGVTSTQILTPVDPAEQCARSMETTDPAEVLKLRKKRGGV